MTSSIFWRAFLSHVLAIRKDEDDEGPRIFFVSIMKNDAWMTIYTSECVKEWNRKIEMQNTKLDILNSGSRPIRSGSWLLRERELTYIVWESTSSGYKSFKKICFSRSRLVTRRSLLLCAMYRLQILGSWLILDKDKNSKKLLRGVDPPLEGVLVLSIDSFLT